MAGREALAEGLLWLAALVLGIASVPPSTAPAAWQPHARAPEDLRVVTWNVGEAGGPEGRPLQDADLEDIAATLRELDADLVFLQEVGSPVQLERLRGLLGDAGWQSALTRGSDRSVAVLAQRGSLEVRTFGHRRLLSCRVETSRGALVGAVALHADAFSSEQRNREVARALEALGDLQAQGGAGLLAGDLNLDLGLDKKGDLFTDDEHRDAETYGSLVRRFQDAGLHGGTTAEPDRRLDYVFVDPAAWNVRSAGALKDRRTGLMDHDPLVADLRPRPARR